MAPRSQPLRRPVWQELGVAALATSVSSTVTFPIDTCKSRIQLHIASDASKAPTLPAMAVSIIRKEPMSLFNGLSASLFRNMTYSAARIGLYKPLQEHFNGIYLRYDPAAAARAASDPKLPPPTFVKIAASLMSGTLGACIGNPFDLVKVRMQAGTNGGLLEATRAVCSGVDGVLGLWRGLSPNVARSALHTSSQLVSYDWCKGILTANLPNAQPTFIHIASGLLSGVVTTTVINPVDVVKTRMFNEKQTSRSAGVLKVTREAIAEGALWRGWTANYVRLGPHVLLTMVCYEKIKTLMGWSDDK